MPCQLLKNADGEDAISVRVKATALPKITLEFVSPHISGRVNAKTIALNPSAVGSDYSDFRILFSRLLLQYYFPAQLGRASGDFLDDGMAAYLVAGVAEDYNWLDMVPENADAACTVALLIRLAGDLLYSRYTTQNDEKVFVTALSKRLAQNSGISATELAAIWRMRTSEQTLEREKTTASAATPRSNAARNQAITSRLQRGHYAGTLSLVAAFESEGYDWVAMIGDHRIIPIVLYYQIRKVARK